MGAPVPKILERKFLPPLLPLQQHETPTYSTLWYTEQVSLTF